MKRVFVYEYLSGGGFIPSAADPMIDDEAAAAELLPLGLKMRDALAEDLLRAGCELTLASSARVPPGLPPMQMQMRTVMPSTGESAFDFVARQAARHDAAWVVAPETGSLLARLARLVGPQRWIGCTAEAIVLCTGKRATLRHLASHGVLTPLAFEAEARRWVSKPDDGAGCVATRLVDKPADEVAAGMTVEPWVEGDPLSVSLLCRPGATEVLAINRQHIGIQADGRLSFDGVALNAVAPQGEQGRAIGRLARQVGRAIPGLRGFVGIDLVWHDGCGPVLIEVNPRVTVAYAGMSAALGRNLAGEILMEIAGVAA